MLDQAAAAKVTPPPGPLPAARAAAVAGGGGRRAAAEAGPRRAEANPETRRLRISSGALSERLSAAAAEAGNRRVSPAPPSPAPTKRKTSKRFDYLSDLKNF